MKVKYRIKEALQFFAFYPKTKVKIYFRLCDGNTNVQAVDPENLLEFVDILQHSMFLNGIDYM